MGIHPSREVGHKQDTNHMQGTQRANSTFHASAWGRQDTGENETMLRRERDGRKRNANMGDNRCSPPRRVRWATFHVHPPVPCTAAAYLDQTKRQDRQHTQRQPSGLTIVFIITPNIQDGPKRDPPQSRGVARAKRCKPLHATFTSQPLRVISPANACTRSPLSDGLHQGMYRFTGRAVHMICRPWTHAKGNHVLPPFLNIFFKVFSCMLSYQHRYQLDEWIRQFHPSHAPRRSEEGCCLCTFRLALTTRKTLPASQFRNPCFLWLPILFSSRRRPGARYFPMP